MVQLGKYELFEQLGRGGYGTVYRARDAALNVERAVKVLHAALLAADPEFVARFRHEAQVAARLEHPHIVPVYDLGEENERPYFAMEFLEGENLAQRVERDGPVPERQVLVWAQQLLEALAYCHAQGIVHRDIKPQNIFLRPDGRAVLVDFGLVKLWNPNDPRTQTVMRGLGTPEYAPPEQYDTQSGHTDPRSDIYSLGATLYHALTGQAPPTATQRIARRAAFQPPRLLNQQLSSTTDAAILQALELTVEYRFPSATAMAQALRSKGRPATPPPSPPPARQP